MNLDAWTLLLALLLAHFVTDFILQPDSWVEGKRTHGAKSRDLLLHALVAGALTGLVLWGRGGWWPPLIVAASHWLIDWLKVRAGRDGLVSFLLDQALHMAVLVGVWVWFLGGSVQGAWTEAIAAAGVGRILVLSMGVVLVTGVGSVLVAMLTRQWQQEMEEDEDVEGDRVQGLRRAGRWIGMLERLWILLFVLTGHWQAIGFLVAAKTVLRFKEITGGDDRKVAEYILVGTLMSFLWAVCVALAVRWGMDAWIEAVRT